MKGGGIISFPKKKLQNNPVHTVFARKKLCMCMGVGGWGYSNSNDKKSEITIQGRSKWW